MALTLSAYAKINLTLEVLGPRADGYHEVRSVLQAVSLADTLTLQPHPDIDFHCDHPRLGGVENMVMKAALLLKESTGYQSGAAIYLRKAIPIAAGLGGGSSDAATTLRGLDKLWGLNLGRETLHTLASQLGADVPFFLYNGTALVEGRGDLVTPLPPLVETWVVLLVPPHSLGQKTQELYASLEPLDYTTGEATMRLVQAIKQGQPLLSSLLHNVFQRPAYVAFSALEEYHRCFLAAGASSLHLTGTGPALFTLATDEAQGQEIYQGLQRQGLGGYLVRTIAPL